MNSSSFRRGEKVPEVKNPVLLALLEDRPFGTNASGDFNFVGYSQKVITELKCLSKIKLKVGADTSVAQKTFEKTIKRKVFALEHLIQQM